MKTTHYFETVTLIKHPEVKREWCERVLAEPLTTEVQADGRVIFWGPTMHAKNEREPYTQLLSDSTKLRSPEAPARFEEVFPSSGARIWEPGVEGCHTRRWRNYTQRLF